MKQSKRYSFYTTLNYLPNLIHNSTLPVLLLLFATQSSKILQKSAALLSLLSNWKIEKKKEQKIFNFLVYSLRLFDVNHQNNVWSDVCVAASD